MENQVNVGNQNTQPVGQNPVSQPAQVLDKPKTSLTPIIVVATLCSLVFGFGGYFLGKQSSLTEQTTNQGQLQPTPVSSSDTTTNPTPTSEISNWKTYSNQEYKFQLKYPPNWSIESTPIMPGAKYLTLLTLNTQYKLPSNYEENRVLFAVVYFDLGNKTLNEWVEELKTQGQINAKVKGSSVINGYTFYEVEGLGAMYETKEFFVKISDNKYLNLGLQPFPIELKQDLFALETTLNQILTTFKFVN